MADEEEAVSRECIECDAPGCGKPNPQKRCSSCKCTYYCDATCEKSHWKEHEPSCFDVEEVKEVLFPMPATQSSEHNGEMECAICLSSTLVDPYVLPECNHSFCFECLRDYFQAVSDLGGELKCPYCRATTGNIEEHLIEQALLYVSKAGRKEVPADKKAEYLDVSLTEIERVIASGSEDKYLLALHAKVEILLALDRADDALVLLDQIIEVNACNKENARLINEKLREYEVAMAEGREDDADCAVQEAEGMVSRLPTKRFATLYDVYLLMAQAKEKLNDWEGAHRVYIGHFFTEMDYDESTPDQQGKMLMGLSRCMYELGEYDKAIKAGQGAIRMSRRVAGVHKYVALSLKAKGDLEGARQIITRAILYESPWDDDNREETKQLLRELEESED